MILHFYYFQIDITYYFLVFSHYIYLPWCHTKTFNKGLSVLYKLQKRLNIGQVKLSLIWNIWNNTSWLHFEQVICVTYLHVKSTLIRHCGDWHITCFDKMLIILSRSFQVLNIYVMINLFFLLFTHSVYSSYLIYSTICFIY